KLGIAELNRRDIDRELQLGRPVLCLQQRLFHHPHRERGNLPRLLGDRDEIGRLDDAACRRTPASKDLKSVKLTTVEADQWLEIGDELVGLDRTADFLLQRDTALELPLHLPVEPCKAVAPRALD